MRCEAQAVMVMAVAATATSTWYNYLHVAQQVSVHVIYYVLDVSKTGEGGSVECEGTLHQQSSVLRPRTDSPSTPLASQHSHKMWRTVLLMTVMVMVVVMAATVTDPPQSLQDTDDATVDGGVYEVSGNLGGFSGFGG
ncbi:hypothetical protein O3P69_006058 [Scylla paramamosain]|uniref:Uncharacterized protein n=1 Tax=Scylla paramamosain TaxID=85552 RepID=A0AAW0U4W7_SCYPA